MSTLEEIFPVEMRKNIYCMHFLNDFHKKIEEKGFQYVQAKNQDSFGRMTSENIE